MDVYLYVYKHVYRDVCDIDQFKSTHNLIFFIQKLQNEPNNIKYR